MPGASEHRDRKRTTSSNVFFLQTTLPPPSVAVLCADHLPAKVSHGDNFPADVSSTNHIPSFLCRRSVRRPLSHHGFFWNQTPNQPSPPKRRMRRGQCGGAKNINSWERYGATAKQIITPFQLYDLQLLGFLSVSQGSVTQTRES